MTDTRLVNARARLNDDRTLNHYEQADLLAVAEERERLTIGLVSENAALRARARNPEAVDLTEVSTPRPVVRDRTEVVRPYGRSFPPDIAKRRLAKRCAARNCTSEPKYTVGFALISRYEPQ